MVLNYEYNKFLVLISTELSKDKFLQKVGAKVGYALSTFSNMYDALTSELVDVEQEYAIYYNFEYNSFKHYLYKKYNIPNDDIDLLLDEQAKNPSCRIYKWDDSSYGNSQLTRFAFVDSMVERVENLLLNK